eukprot:5531995-Karenia_brevis.AAC.1
MAVGEDTSGEGATLGLGLAAGKPFPSPFAHAVRATWGNWLAVLLAGTVWLKTLTTVYPGIWSLDF